MSNKWSFEYDGCSMPAIVAGLFGIDKDNPAEGYKTQFALCGPSATTDKACDRHDECYQTCYSTDEADEAKTNCDRRMHDDMHKACFTGSEDWEVLKDCLTYAELYYAALKTPVALSAFDERQAQVCSCGVEPSTPGLPSVTTYRVTPTRKG